MPAALWQPPHSRVAQRPSPGPVYRLSCPPGPGTSQSEASNGCRATLCGGTRLSWRVLTHGGRRGHRVAARQVLVVGDRARAPTPGDADVLGRIPVRAWQRRIAGRPMPLRLPDACRAGQSSDVAAASGARTAPVRRGWWPRPRTPRGGLHRGRTGRGMIPTPRRVRSTRAERRPGSLACWCGLRSAGVGRGRLTAFGSARAVLWVHPGNVGARRVYEVHSGPTMGSSANWSVLGVVVPETCYSRSVP